MSDRAPEWGLQRLRWLLLIAFAHGAAAIAMNHVTVVRLSPFEVYGIYGFPLPMMSTCSAFSLCYQVNVIAVVLNFSVYFGACLAVAWCASRLLRARMPERLSWWLAVVGTAVALLLGCGTLLYHLAAYAALSGHTLTTDFPELCAQPRYLMVGVPERFERRVQARAVERGEVLCDDGE